MVIAGSESGHHGSASCFEGTEVLPDYGDFGFSVLLEVLLEPSRSHPVSRRVAAVTAARNENHFCITIIHTKFLVKQVDSMEYGTALRMSSRDHVVRVTIC